MGSAFSWPPRWWQKLSQQLRLTLAPTLGIPLMDMALDIMADMDTMDILHTGHTMVDMDIGEERRGKLSQLPKPMLRLKLILGTLPTDMVLDITDILDMVLDIMAIPHTDHTMVDTAIGEKRRGKPSQ